jgi:hypothetical protein
MVDAKWLTYLYSEIKEYGSMLLQPSQSDWMIAVFVRLPEHVLHARENRQKMKPLV